MPNRVFVSHAAADAPLVGELVDKLIVMGSGVAEEEEVFCSSGAATGVPAGTSFHEYIRKELDGARIIVAVITPQFMASAFCLAEVGAAWAQVQDFVPLAIPSMDRAALRGVLPGLQVNLMDEVGALDELHDRVCAAMGKEPSARKWGPRKAAFEAELDDLVAQLQPAPTVPQAELAAAQESLAQAQQALREQMRLRREAEARTKAVLATDDPAERRQLALPSDERERFRALLHDAQGMLRELSQPVALAVWAHIASRDLEMPGPMDDPYLLERMQADVARGHLLEFEGVVEPNAEYPDIADAIEAASNLDKFLRSASADFTDWFAETYRKPPRLGHKDVWDALI